jgi:hypothetical protein
MTNEKCKHAACSSSSSVVAVFDVQWRCMDEVPCLPRQEAALFGLLVREDEMNLRGKDLPEERLADIQRESSALGMSVLQALSLRRMMMRGALGISSYSMCGAYGDHKAIEKYAAELELSVARLLSSHGIPFVDEQAQKACRSCSQGTPDFVIGEGVKLYINGRRVRWIECKAFYGAAMFTARGDEKNVPVAKVKRIAERYVASHGPGAFVFRQGYNRHLRGFIASRDVVLLDATPLDLEEGPFMG